jgi:chromosome segregation ATPase
MNAIVKVFLILNLMLSAFYCAFQVVLFTSRQDWKTKYLEVKAESQTSQENSDKREAELSELLETAQDSLAGHKEKLVVLDVTTQELKSKLEAELSDKKNTQQELQEKSARVTVLEESVSKRTEELSDVREQLTGAREIAETSRASSIDLRELVVVYEKEKGKLRGDLEILQSKMVVQQDELKKADRLMARLEERGIEIDSLSAGDAIGAETPINAKVLSVREDVNVILLSVGKKDQVKEGYQFTIYQGGTYKGKVMVESVYPNMCSARILDDLMAEAQTIQEGDNASTRIY